MSSERAAVVQLRAMLREALPMAPIKLTLAACMAFCISSCTYLRYAGVQAQYARIQRADPTQLNVKHMIDRDTYFVHGLCKDPRGMYAGLPKVIAAFSSKYKANERVGTMYFEVAGSHFGLNLPEGKYTLVVLADVDGDGTFGPSEVVGKRSVDLNSASAPDKVLGQADVLVGAPIKIDWEVSIDAPTTQGRSESLFFPLWDNSRVG